MRFLALPARKTNSSMFAGDGELISTLAVEEMIHLAAAGQSSEQ